MEKIAAEIDSRVTRFFQSYRTAFHQLDTSAVADQFDFPVHITSAGDAVAITSVPTREEWMKELGRLMATYRQLGVSARILDLRIALIMQHVVHATVRWELAAARTPLYEFVASYTLVIHGDTIRVAAIGHDELPRLREALKEAARG